jgi:hypothetical protein
MLRDGLSPVLARVLAAEVHHVEGFPALLQTEDVVFRVKD